MYPSLSLAHLPPLPFPHPSPSSSSISSSSSYALPPSPFLSPSRLRNPIAASATSFFTASFEFRSADEPPRSSDELIREGSEAQVLESAPEAELKIQKVPKKKYGAAIVNLLQVFHGLLEHPSGSGQMMAAAGRVVMERVTEEAQNLRNIEDVDQQLIGQFLGSVEVLEMDLQLVEAAQEEAILFETVSVAKERCQQALLVARGL